MHSRMNAHTGKVKKMLTKARTIILMLCSILILIPLTFGRIAGFPYLFVFIPTILMAIGSCLTIIIILVRIDGKPDMCKMRKLPVILMVLTGLGILAAFMHHNTGGAYPIMALDMILLFPLLYAIETDRRDYCSIIQSFSLPMIMATIIIFALCLYKATIGESIFDGNRYFGPITNPNTLSTIGTYGVMCSLYMAHISRRTLFRMISLGFSAGCGMAVTILGASRTSALALAGCILVEIIYLIKSNRFLCPPADKYSKTSALKHLRRRDAVIVFVLTASLMLIPVRYVYTTPGIQRAASVDSEASDGRVVGILERFSRDGESLDTFSSGRLDIWRIYFENLSIRGGDPAVIESEVLKTHHDPNAHNTYLTIAYVCGIPTGIVYFLWVLCIGIYGIAFVFGRRYTLPEHSFAAMIIYSFAMQSMLDIAVFPFFSLPICFFSFCIAPVFEKELKHG